MNPTVYRVAAIQLDCRGRRPDIEERVRQLVADAARKGASVVCLPEHWLPGRDSDLEGSMAALRAAAQESRVHLIAGADFVRKRDGKLVVESVVLGPDGEEVGRQQKTHLFMREKDKAQPGEELEVLPLDGIMVGIAICHDLVYPEVARVLALQGAEVLFAPAKIGASGLQPWELYVKARSLENRIPIVSPNCFSPPRFIGGSLIVGFSADTKRGIVYPEVRARGEKGQAVLLADLDLQEAAKYRSERLSARRPALYSRLCRS